MAMPFFISGIVKTNQGKMLKKRGLKNLLKMISNKATPAVSKAIDN
ncbi:MAG TPA: hypothetical protein VNW49_15010 [Puia sp.]|nr:hypothetical protein [Puia sp.]